MASVQFKRATSNEVAIIDGQMRACRAAPGSRAAISQNDLQAIERPKRGRSATRSARRCHTRARAGSGTPSREVDRPWETSRPRSSSNTTTVQRRARGSPEHEGPSLRRLSPYLPLQRCRARLTSKAADGGGRDRATDFCGRNPDAGQGSAQTQQSGGDAGRRAAG